MSSSAVAPAVILSVFTAVVVLWLAGIWNLYHILFQGLNPDFLQYISVLVFLFGALSLNGSKSEK